MTKPRKSQRFEKGQKIPLIGVLFLVIIGMVALLTDGSILISNHRTALSGAKRARSGFSGAFIDAEAY